MKFLNALEAWIASHPALVVSVGVPLLTVVVAGCISFLTTRANTEAQERQLRLNHQLKLADFRQSWINDMRNDLAIYTARTWSEELNEGIDAQKEIITAQARILMRMNPSDPDYKAMLESLHKPVADPLAERKALFVVGQRILKREWERLKADLKHAERK